MIRSPAHEVRCGIERHAGRLLDLSHRIHAHPELGFEEHRACTWVSEELATAGFVVDQGAHGLATSVDARFGTGPLRITICAEYDALPGIGHACGHNIIAAAAVGAALALVPVADELGLTVHLLGTPAEESGGGKVLLLERGAFDASNAAMMVHPSPFDRTSMECVAVGHLEVEYLGRAAHASAFPEVGINAADALTISQTAIGLLRQHLRHGDQVHGIVTHGGDAANIVPDRTSGKWFVRAPTLERLEQVESRVNSCFEAGALGTGCELSVNRPCPSYSEMRFDDAIASVYRSHAEVLGRRFLIEDFTEATGGTDMANVSLALPAIHPLIGLRCWPVSSHQPEFAAICASVAGDKAVLDGALAMALTCVDLALDAGHRARLLAAAGPR